MVPASESFFVWTCTRDRCPLSFDVLLSKTKIIKLVLQAIE